MDVPTSPSTPLGPMTRARAKAIEDQVNSLLFELPLPTHETWLLPHSETLCVINYMEVSQGSTTCKSQDGKDPKHDGQEKELQQKLQASDVRPCPDVGRVPGHGRPDPPDVRYQATRTESTDVRDAPDDRTTNTLAKTTEDRQPPDVRPLQKLRTSDHLRTTDAPTPELKRRTSERARTTGPSRASGRPTSFGRPVPE